MEQYNKPKTFECRKTKNKQGYIKQLPKNPSGYPMANEN